MALPMTVTLAMPEPDQQCRSQRLPPTLQTFPEQSWAVKSVPSFTCALVSMNDAVWDIAAVLAIDGECRLLAKAAISQLQFGR